MRGAQDVQFCVKPETKDGIDKFKLKHKDDILKHMGKTKRFVSNDDAVRYLLHSATKRKRGEVQA